MNEGVVRHKAPTNRGTRRELGRRVVKHLTDEFKETQRRPRKKVRLKPPVPKQLKPLSFFTSRCDHVVDSLERWIGWLRGLGAALPAYIMILITVLALCFHRTEEKNTVRKSTPGLVASKEAIPLAEGPSTGVYKRDKESTSEEASTVHPATRKPPIDETSETARSVSEEAKSLAAVHSAPATSSDSDNATAALSTPSVSSPRPSIGIDTSSGKSAESPWYLQQFDRIAVQGLRKCISNDRLERYIWARDDEDAANHVPRSMYFSDEISRWWSDET